MSDPRSARLVVHAFALGGLLPPEQVRALEEGGWSVLQSADTRALRKLAAHYPADAALIAWTASSRPSALARLRRALARPGVPLIALLDGGGPDETHAIDAGADDALRAPAAVELLAARVEAAVRSAERWNAPEAWPRHVLRPADGEVALDMKARRCRLRRDGAYLDVTLTPRQAETLAALLRRPGRPVSWERLYRRGWRPKRLRKRSRTMVQHVLGLRRKLGAAGRRIEAVPGFGYRFRD